MRPSLRPRILPASAALALGALLAAPGGTLAAPSNVARDQRSPIVRGGGLLEPVPSASVRAAAAAARGGRAAGYGGATSQARPVAIQAAGSRRRVTLFVIDWSGSCSDGDPASVTTGMPRMAAGRTGRFGRVRTERQVDDEQVVTYRNEVAGRLRPGRATGTFRTRVTAANLEGRTLWRCDSGNVRFSLPRAYAGLTEQGYPLALQTSTDGRRLQGAFVGVEAGCERPGYAYHLTGALPLAGTAIGPDGRLDGIAEEARDLGNLTAALSRRLTGALSAGRASGALHAHADIVDKATGARIDQCDSGEVGWTAVR